MGNNINMCFTGSRAAHSNYGNDPSSSQHQTSNFTSRNGQAVSTSTLPYEDRERFLNRFDPIRRLGLTEDTRLYRSTERRYIENGTLRGHQGSVARINNYDQAKPNSMRHSYMQAYSHTPVSMRARDLNVPTLNVMVGSGAMEGAEAYSSSSHATVEMRLGDVLRQGGRVYEDTSAIADSDESRALVVTLPRRAIPVNILN
jgi:hypothetical protein